jgi:hypothetical protein
MLYMGKERTYPEIFRNIWEMPPAIIPETIVNMLLMVGGLDARPPMPYNMWVINGTPNG